MKSRKPPSVSTAQLPLFASLPPLTAIRSPEFGPTPRSPAPALPPEEAPAALTDDALLQGLRAAFGERRRALAEEAGRRQLSAAIPSLVIAARPRDADTQIAALRALENIGGEDAAAAVVKLMQSQLLTREALNVGVLMAAKLGCRLGAGGLEPLAEADEPEVRLALCHCLKPGPEAVDLLRVLLGDPAREVALFAARSLALRGLPDGIVPLVEALRGAPMPEDIDAVACIADESLMVELGKTARANPALAPMIIEALEGMEVPQAGLVAGGLRRDLGEGSELRVFLR
jgi:HEAT repeat protein